MIEITYSIRCDGCSAYYDCDSESIGYLEKRAKQNGWAVENQPNDCKHYCPKCKTEATNEKIN